MSNTFDKLSVLDSFIEEVNSYLPEIETNLERLAQSPGDMDALEETYRRTHTIGGSASMMDFPGLAHVSHGMEDILGDVLDGVTTLDPLTIGLLQRSLGRMHQLLRGIHGGINEDAIIAEDDADYTQYRIAMESATQGESQEIVQNQPLPVVPQPPVPALPAIPSLDEMLASFRTPSVSAGEDIGWPEDPAPAPDTVAFPEQDTPLTAPTPSVLASQINEPTSALEMLASTTNQPPISDASSRQTTAPLEAREETSSGSLLQSLSGRRTGEQLAAPAGARASSDSFASIYDDMQRETQALETQAISLKSLLTQLRTAASVIETQRTEFRSFLDGSKDALDRMEEWAGQAMGLNLRNSPEQVRRYLPLSVMWVANSKLKKILDLLNTIAGGVATTDEQIETILEQLRATINDCDSAFQQLEAEKNQRILAQEPGWSPWEMRVTHDPGTVQERVTFERRGDLQAMRAEIEAQLREEMRHEYESRPFTLAARAELERQIRSEVLQELEANRQLQESLSGAERRETLQEIEARLRNEIEIQVRREFLNNLTERVVGTQADVPPIQPPAPQVSNFVDRAREIAGVSTPVETPQPVFQQPAPQPPVVAQPIIQPTSSGSRPSEAVSTFSGDFGEEAAEIFRLEAEEHLQAISMRVAALEKSPADRDLIQGIRRATHTLKGAAGMMGFRLIADICHVAEDLLDSVIEGKTAITPAVLGVILDTTETLDRLIHGREDEHGNIEAVVSSLRARYIELLGEVSTATEEELDIEDEPLLGSSVVVDQTQPAEANGQHAARSDLSVRVRLQKLDELVNLFGELLVNRSILEERIERLVRLVADVGISSARLRDVGQKLESRFEAATLPSGRSLQMVPGNGNQGAPYSFGGASRGTALPGAAHLAEFDELELDRYTEFHQLTRGLSEGISDMTTLSTEMEALIRECESVFARENRLSTTFQDRLLKARLVPLSVMTPRLYRAARSVALKQHKEFDFLLEGESAEIDRTVSEEIAGPLLHLIRNAVNHGIETPQVRMQKGKSPVGQIKLSASYEGNQVVITVRDDGSGIDAERVRNAAIARGLISPDHMLSDNDVFGLIFQPGFSTAEVLSEESGRGVGLDVVRDSVARLKGTLEVETMPGHGTAFTMKFPTSLAIQNAMVIRIGTQQYAIPTVMIEAIGRLDSFKRTTINGRPAITVQNETYLIQILAQLLGMTPGPLDEKSQLILVNAGGHRIALIVDEIKSRMDVVIKTLGPHLRHVHGVAGATVLGNGRVVLILELMELIAGRPHVAAPTAVPAWQEGVVVSAPQATTQTATVSAVPERRGATVFTNAPAPRALPERGKHILVVDDSPSVRRVVSNMLKQHGWQVQMARDGVEALEMITNETPAAVLLDIEMPRMDGYELMATVRAQEQYRTLPLVVLTSRAAAKHQQRAMQLGANAYVVKPYQDEELLNMLNTLVYGAVA